MYAERVSKKVLLSLFTGWILFTQYTFVGMANQSYGEYSQVEVRRALLEEQDHIIGQPEYCSIDSSLMDSLGLETGQQIRVTLKGDPEIYAIYTIAQARDEGGTILRMGLDGRRRLKQRDPFEAYVSTVVVYPELETKEEAREKNELVESLDDHVEHNDLVVIAPHGGFIEKHTDEQSTALAADPLLSDYGVSVWNCYGYHSKLGAYTAWHISSTDIDERNFPRLNQIIHRGFKFAVAFHGFRAEGYQIVLGGNTEYILTTGQTLKERIKELIVEKSNGQIRVTLAQPGHRLGGYSPENIVNRLASQELGGYGGIQIESSFRVREGFRYEVVDALSQALREALDNEIHREE